MVNPLSLIDLILISMLFIFGSNRDITLGRKIFVGVSIGLSFELISRLGGAFSLSFEISPFLSYFVPSLLAVVIAIFILISKSKHS
jgi:lipopolysaccharide export system permease protein